MAFIFILFKVSLHQLIYTLYVMSEESYINEKWSNASVKDKLEMLKNFSGYSQSILDNIILHTKDFDQFIGSVIWDITGGKYQRHIKIKEIWDRKLNPDVPFAVRYGIIMESAKKYNISESIARFIYSFITNVDNFIEYIGPLYKSLKMLEYGGIFVPVDISRF